MNREKTEALVRLVASGRNTYRHIKAALPEITDSDLRYASMAFVGCAITQRPLRLAKSHPEGLDYQFPDDEIFFLTEYGQDILYQCRKEWKMEILAYITAVTSILGLLISVLK